MTVEALKQELLRLTESRDTDSLSQKVQFFKNTLEPVVKELSTHNPVPNVANIAHLAKNVKLAAQVIASLCES